MAMFASFCVTQPWIFCGAPGSLTKVSSLFVCNSCLYISRKGTVAHFRRRSLAVHYVITGPIYANACALSNGERTDSNPPPIPIQPIRSFGFFIAEMIAGYSVAIISHSKKIARVQLAPC